MHSAGVKEHYDVVYGWPGDDEKEDKPEQCIFTREFGENVDDWYAHNNNNRASRSWGERPLLIQALSLAKSYDEMYRTTGQFIGGTQWHPFDHQRGYRPIHTGEAFMTLSVRKSMRMKCSAANLRQASNIRWQNADR